jgi:hypothetical protein
MTNSAYPIIYKHEIYDSRYCILQFIDRSTPQGYDKYLATDLTNDTKVYLFLFDTPECLSQTLEASSTFQPRMMLGYHAYNYNGVYEKRVYDKNWNPLC